MITRLTEDEIIEKRNWIPKKDEVILANTFMGPRVKIGDGVTKLSDLSFIDQGVIDKAAKMAIESYAFHKDDFSDIDRKINELDKKIDNRNTIIYILLFLIGMFIMIAHVNFKIMFM